MRCLQSNGKKTSDKDNTMATKPTKQQVAQAKARAGGNNPIKVTNKGLKKLGSAALIIGSVTPVGRGVKAVSIAGKMAKTADARRKFNAATERRILDNQVKKSVKVLPRNSASGPGLETRGVKPTRLQRSERAAELSFKKAEGRYEGEYLTRMTGLRGPKGVTSQRTRGQGTRSLRKEAAINKEAKAKIVRINSQRNLEAK